MSADRTPAPVAVEAYRFAQGMAVTERARGRQVEERAWLDLLHLLDQAAPSSPAPVAVPEAALVAGVAARREYLKNREQVGAKVIDVDEVHRILTAAAPHLAPTPAPVAVPTPALDSLLAEADERARNQSGTCTGEHCEGCESGRRVARARAELAALAPRPEPVVAPLPTEAVEAMEKIIADRLEAIHVPESADRDSVEMDAQAIARDLIAAGYRLVPEDDEDTVRVPRIAVERLAEVVDDAEMSDSARDRRCAEQAAHLLQAIGWPR